LFKKDPCNACIKEAPIDKGKRQRAFFCVKDVFFAAANKGMIVSVVGLVKLHDVHIIH